MKLKAILSARGATAMQKLLYAATIASTFLPSGATQAQCPCDRGYYGYGPAYYGSTTFPPAYYGPPAPPYYAYAAPAYYGYDDRGVDSYYRGPGGYGAAGASVRLGNYGGASIDVGQFGYGHSAIDAGRIGWRGGYGYRRNTRRHGYTPPPPTTIDHQLQRPNPESSD